MIALVEVNTTDTPYFIIKKIEGLSTDNKDSVLSKLSLNNLGSSFLELDTSEVYKLNTESDNVTLKWYKL